MNALILFGAMTVEGVSAWVGGLMAAAGGAWIVGLNLSQKTREHAREERIRDLKAELELERIRNDAQGRCTFRAVDCQSVRDELAAMKRRDGSKEAAP